MSETSVRIFYRRAEFTALLTADINLDLLAVDLAALTLSAPFANVTMLPLAAGVAVEWDTLPLEADEDLVSAAIAAHVGAETTSQPFVYESFATSTTTSNTHQTKIDETTPPLAAGTYQVSWVCSTKMATIIANAGVEARIRLERSDGQFVQQDDAWDRANRHAYNGSQPFQVAEGQTIRALLTFARLGASGTAEMSGARVTVDKL